jgi:MFS family permease
MLHPYNIQLPSAEYIHARSARVRRASIYIYPVRACVRACVLVRRATGMVDSAGDDDDATAAGSDNEKQSLLGRAPGDDVSSAISSARSESSIYAAEPQSASPTGGVLQVFMSLLFTIYMPCFLFNLAGSITDPVLPLFATSLGGSVALAGAAVSVERLTSIFFSVPAGIVFRTLGAGGTMTVGAAIAGGAMILGSQASSVEHLLVALLLLGLGNALWKIARSTFIRMAVPEHLRGRAVSFNTAVSRASQVLGPSIGGFVATRWGLADAMLLRGCLAVLAAAFVLVVTCIKSGGVVVPARRKKRRGHGLETPTPICSLVFEYRKAYLTAGVSTVFLMVVKLCRKALVPLVGASLGLRPAAIGADMSAMGIADLTLVPLAGWAMDAKGRKTAGVPAMFIMAGGFALLATLPLVSEITGLGAAWLVLASAVIIGAGSGCASGLNQVLGMDHAPSGAADSATFLSVWRMMSDSGALIGPVLAGLIAEQWNVYVASLCVSTVGMLGALWLLCVVKTWSSDT